MKVILIEDPFWYDLEHCTCVYFVTALSTVAPAAFGHALLCAETIGALAGEGFFACTAWCVRGQEPKDFVARYAVAGARYPLRIHGADFVMKPATAQGSLKYAPSLMDTLFVGVKGFC